MLRSFVLILAVIAGGAAHAVSLVDVQNKQSASAVAPLAGVHPVNSTVDRRLAVPEKPYVPANGLTTGPNTTHFRYDADGNLVGEVLAPGTADEQRVRYVVDSGHFPPVVLEEFVNGRHTRSYVWGIGTELLFFTDFLPSGQAITHHAHDDGHGSIRFLTDDLGTVTDTFEYDAFGNVIGRTGTTDLKFLFRSEHLNSSTGWYHLRARWMNPSTARFATRDPFPGVDEIPQSLHDYSYAVNDPVNESDPTGLTNLIELNLGSSLQNVSRTIPGVSGKAANIASSAPVFKISAVASIVKWTLGPALISPGVHAFMVAEGPFGMFRYDVGANSVGEALRNPRNAVSGQVRMTRIGSWSQLPRLRLSKVVARMNAKQFLGWSAFAVSRQEDEVRNFISNASEASLGSTFSYCLLSPNNCIGMTGKWVREAIVAAKVAEKVAK